MEGVCRLALLLFITSECEQVTNAKRGETDQNFKLHSQFTETNSSLLRYDARRSQDKQLTTTEPISQGASSTVGYRETGTGIWNPGTDYQNQVNDSSQCIPTWPEFFCGDNKNRFTFQVMCDGHDDCGDSSDECESMCTQMFTCSRNRKCIALDRYCDGAVNCDDGSDEIYANESEPNGFDQAKSRFVCSNHWLTNDTERRQGVVLHKGRLARCHLPLNLLCDGINHCGDHSDECDAGCGGENYFICNNGRCIAAKHRCDYNDDCGDGSDECTGCQSTFQCDDGTCIPLARFCDGDVDCKDGSDERYSVNENATSDIFGSPVVICDNIRNFIKTSCVLPPKYICDGTEHCLYREDECVPGCSYSFICGNGNCLLSNDRCNGFDNCGDMSDECEAGCSRTFRCSNGRCLSVDRFCDGIDDCGDGSDEVLERPGEPKDANNTEHFYCARPRSNGVRKCRLPHQYLCDGNDHCIDRSDECQAQCEYSFICDGGENCIPRSQVCDGMRQCRDGADEVKSSTALASLRGFKCYVNRFGQSRSCVLPQALVNDSVPDCEDEIDICLVTHNDTSEPNNESTCVGCLSDPGVVISKKQVCDGAFDCPDLSDECLCQDVKASSVCGAICFGEHIEEQCPCPHGEIPCVVTPGHATVVLLRTYRFDDHDTESMDDFFVAEALSNTTSHASQNAPRRDKIGNSDTRIGRTQCIHASLFCDGVVHCRNGADEITCGRTLECADSPVVEGETSQVHADSGEERTQDVRNPLNMCEPNHICTKHMLGNKWTPKYAIACDGNPECFDLEDECAADCPKPLPQFCEFRNSEGFFACPENAILPGLKVCDGGRNCTESGQDEIGCPGRYYCAAGRIASVETHRRCDFSSDCEDASDETNCTETHFYCEGGNPFYVPLRRKFDGKDDCSDGSDECPANSFDNSIFSSREYLIDNLFLSMMVWVMGLLSVVGNTSVMVHTLRTIITEKRKLTNMAMIYNFLVLNLSVADMLMGFFLLTLGVESALMSGIYCREDKGWRSGTTCNVLGILATVSSETSIVVLAILSTYRLSCVIRPISSREFRLRSAALFALITWTGAILVAVLPLCPSLSSYFVTEAWLATNPYFVSDVVNRSAMESFTSILRTYMPPTYTNSTDAPLTWTAMSKLLTELNPSYDTLGYFGYYSTHAVCLPKIFVTRRESAWQYSFVLTLFNFLTFLYIVIVYMMMWRPGPMVRKQPSGRASGPGKATRNMQKRIALLVATDFACWVPTCMIAFLCLAGVNVSDAVYALAAIVLLPINSALNPILYSNALQGVWRTISRLVNACKMATFRRDKRENPCADNHVKIRLVPSAATHTSSPDDSDDPTKRESLALVNDNAGRPAVDVL